MNKKSWALMEKILEDKVWYRVFKVISIVVVILSFFSPLFINYNIFESEWFWDGIINVFIWVLVFWVIKRVIVYILYGKNPKILQEIQHE